MRLLMHLCCANCALFPIRHVRGKGISLSGLWYNPNVHPGDEYARRLEALKALETLWGLDIQYVDRYGLEEFKSAVSAHDGVRCEACYLLRLRETARRARAEGFDGFTTSLLVSPYQKTGLILQAGRQAQEEQGVLFYAPDFKQGWAEAERLSRELGLYRQYYCGCIYSKAERDRERAERKARSERAGT
jgi:predicted adenine nucleotide alpha hydrolase (AANH) superfamily ATPase